MNILEQNKEKINGKLSFFDRVIVNGYLTSFFNDDTFKYYLSQNNILLKDFGAFAENSSKILCSHIEHFCEENNISVQYLNSGKISKDELANNEFQKNPNKIGLISAFTVVELCKTKTVKGNYKTKLLEVITKETKCKHYYLYFNDKELGWMFFKIQTWFPFNVQIYFNGHEYLAKQFDKQNIKYEMFNNSFSYIEDYEKANKIIDSFMNKNLSSTFDFLANQINCFLTNIKEILNCSYYWCLDQCEFATDINFKSREDLSLFYKKLVETSYFTFSCKDIYAFFGRNIKYIQNFKKGEITSDLRNRSQGFRIKFKINKNQIKMYDKGNNLRIEVTINNPKEFKVLKTTIEEETGKEIKKWKPMGKSISNMYRYKEISESIINRYIEALPTIDVNGVSLKQLEIISNKIKVKERPYSGFNLLQEETLKVFQEIANAKYLMNGFTNKLIRKEVFEDSELPKNINKVTRLLAKLKAHGLIKKVVGKNKYYLTTLGREISDNLLLYTGRITLN